MDSWILRLTVLCICAQVHTLPQSSNSKRNASPVVIDADLRPKPFDPSDIYRVPPVSVEAIVGPIDAYLPVEYVFVDDNEIFGGLKNTESDLKGPGQESVISDFVDKTKALLIKIKDYIVSKVRNVINTINKLEVNFQVVKDAVAAAFKRKLDQVVEKAKEGIKKKVAELKKDIGQCLVDSEKKFKEMIKVFLVSEEHCVTDEFHKAFDIARDTKNTILSVIKKVGTLPEEIVTCLKGDERLSCVKKNVWDVAKTYEQALKNIVLQFPIAIAFVTGFESRVASCALDQLGNAGEASFNIVEKFSECVTEKVIKT